MTTRIDLGKSIGAAVGILTSLSVVVLTANFLDWLIPRDWSRSGVIALAFPVGFLVTYASVWGGMIGYVLTFKLVTGHWRATHQTNRSG